MEERESNDLDYHLNDPEDIKEQILINNRKKNIITGIALFLTIGGGSSGSHIALLYAYSYKNSPMEIKFLILILLVQLL